MKIKYRRLLYTIFFLIFFIFGSFLFFDTAGYRYNFKRNKLEKTGILIVNSSPTEAEIFLNGQYQDKTPSRLTKLLPDQYDVEVRKDNFWPWQQKLTISSNLTTFAEGIFLFKKSLPTVKVNGEINILAPEPGQGKIIYSLKKNGLEEIRFLNLETDTDLAVEQLPNKTYDSMEFVAWSPKKNKALLKKIIGDFNQYLIIDAETLKIKELFNITRLNFERVSWDQKNNDYLYGLSGSVLYRIDLGKNSAESLIADHITDFMGRDSEIYYITQVANESLINQVILNQTPGQIKKIKLPDFSEFSLAAAPDGYLALLNKKNNDLFIIKSQVFLDKNMSDNIVVQAQAKNLSWSPDFKKFLYYNDFEIWVYDLTTNEGQLLNRYSEVIREAIWHPKKNYILYLANNAVKAIKVDQSDIKNDLTLAELDNVSELTLDRQGENLYGRGKIGSQQGIYQLELQ